MKSWTHRVVKRMRGADGQYFDFGTAGTFDSEEAARAYAEDFAREQGQAGVHGARIDVRARKKFRSELGTLINTVATYRSDDYPRDPGRPARSEEGAATARLELRVTDAEKSRLRELAETEGVDVSTYVRRRVF